MIKPTISIIISINFSVRYILRSGIIDKLLDKFFVNIFLTWNDPQLVSDFESRGCNVIILPKSHFSKSFIRSNDLLNLWHNKKIIKTGNDRWYEQRCFDDSYNFHIKVLRTLRDLYHHLILINLPFYIKKMRTLKTFDKKNTNIKIFQKIIKKYNSDLVLTLTPFHPDEVLLLKAFEKKHTPIIASILSFDNISKRGIMPFNFSKIFVWNQKNKESMLKSNADLNESDVEIIGPVQFDFYYDKKYTLKRSDWYANKLVKNKKVILYNGGVPIYFKYEPAYLEYIDSAIKNGQIDNAVIILRIHPLDNINRWRDVVDKSKNIIISEVWGQNNKSILEKKYQNITDEDIKILKADLMYSDVHISICSTMVIDGSIFDKPQIGPAFDSRGYLSSKKINNIYRQYHYKEIIKSGALKLSRNKEEFIDDINFALINKKKYKKNRKELIKRLCHYDDGNSSKRLLHHLMLTINDNLSD
tara:strand:- start:81 stop:1496 length:1416 start_codon:yes stop_codon:yes gene_type:complete